jgi:arylsulfatase A-like enzyme
MSNLDIAPTIAQILGVELPAADGKPLPATARQ